MTATINTLPDPSSATFSSALQTFLQQEAANRDVLRQVSSIVSGGLHGTAAGLVGSPGSVVAFPGGYYTTESGSITYSDSKSNIWVVIGKDTTTSPPSNWSVYPAPIT